MKQEQSVELRPAFAWDCPECGREQFARAVVLEMGDVEFSENKAEFGIPQEVEGLFLAAPTVVVCEYCGYEFETIEYGTEDDD